MKTILALALVTSLSTIAYADSGLALLKIETGARPSAMGEAFTAISGDPLSQNYNPAGALTGGASDDASDEFNAYLGQTFYWENITLNSGFTSFAKGSWRFHFSVRSARVEGLQGRGASATAEPDLYFDSRDFSIKSGVAIPLSERLTVGLSLGWMMEKISFYKSSTMTFDLGAMYRQSDKLQFGVSALNVGSALQLDTADIDLPTTLRAGASYLQSDLLFAVDGVIVDEDFHAHVGAEYRGVQSLELRAGFQSGYDSKSVTFGLGFNKRNLRIDYSFVPYKNSLNNSHQFGLSVFVK